MARNGVALGMAAVCALAVACARDSGTADPSVADGASLPAAVVEAVGRCVADVRLDDGHLSFLRADDGYAIAVSAGDPAVPGIVWLSHQDGWSCRDTSFFGFPIPQEADEGTVRVITLELNDSLAILAESNGSVDSFELVGSDGDVFSHADPGDGLGLWLGHPGSAVVTYVDGEFLSATAVRSPAIEVPPFDPGAVASDTASRFVDGLLVGAPSAESVVGGDDVHDMLATLTSLIDGLGVNAVLSQDGEWFGYSFVLQGETGCSQLLLFMSGSKAPKIASYEIRAVECP